MKVLVAATEIGRNDARRTAPGAADAAVARSSFYAALRLLPPAQRDAMFEIYRFCRAVDDIADGGGERRARLAQLEAWRRDIHALFAGHPPKRIRALLEPVRAFDLQREDFLSIVDGMEMDATADIRAPDLATLDLYCDRVACAVGRLSARVFGIALPEGNALAFHLGRALQLTNILRDLDEDARKGRLYLPREALLAAGIEDTEPAVVLAHPRLGQACSRVAESAHGYFAQARALMARQPHRMVRAPRRMANVYRHILERLLARGWASPRLPVHVGRVGLGAMLLLDWLRPATGRRPR